MNEKDLKYTPAKLINSAIAICLMLFFGSLPPIGGITPLGMQILGIFLGAIWGWCTVDLVWPSVLALTLLGFTGYTSVVGAFGALFSNQNVLVVLFFMIIAEMINQSGLGTFIAHKLLGLKFTQGRPWLFSLMLCYVAAIATPLIKFAPAILLCWGFLYNICETTGYKKGDKWPMYMVFGIIYSVSFSAALVPTYAGVQVNIGLMMGAFPDASFPYGTFELLTLLVTVITPALYILTCKYVFRPDVSKLKDTDFSQYSQSEKMTTTQKIVAIYVVALIVCLLATSFVTKTAPVIGILAQLGVLGVTVVFLVIGILVHSEGRPLINFNVMASKGILWNVIIMLGTALTLAGALSSDGTNVKQALGMLLSPIFSDYSPYLFLLVFSIIAMILTNFISNGVVSAIVFPLAFPFAQTIGFSPVALTGLMIFSASLAIMLPSASPVGAMLYSNTEWIKPKDCIRLALVCMVTFAVLLAVLFVPLSMILL